MKLIESFQKLKNELKKTDIDTPPMIEAFLREYLDSDEIKKIKILTNKK
jgi:hypothetical protein